MYITNNYNESLNSKVQIWISNKNILDKPTSK